MTSEFDSFDQSELGAFTQSALMERGEGVSEARGMFVGGQITGFDTGGQNLVTDNIASFNFSADEWSEMDGGVGGLATDFVLALLKSPFENKIVVGGQFENPANSSVFDLAQWNGTEWDDDLGNVSGGRIEALDIYQGNIVACGTFTAIDGVSMNRIGVYNGTTWSALGTGLNNAARGMFVNGNDLYVGGAFTTAGGNTSRRIAKWDGSSWSTEFTVFPNVGDVNDVAFYDGLLYVAGSSNFGLHAWNGSSFEFIDVDSVSGRICTRAKVINGELVVSGSFNEIESVSALRIAKFDGTNWSAFGNGWENAIDDFIPFNNGDILAVGGDSAGTPPAGDFDGFIARFNTSTDWVGIGGDLAAGAGSIRFAKAVLFDDL